MAEKGKSLLFTLFSDAGKKHNQAEAADPAPVAAGTPPLPPDEVSAAQAAAKEKIADLLHEVEAPPAPPEPPIVSEIPEMLETPEAAADPAPSGDRQTAQAGGEGGEQAAVDACAKVRFSTNSMEAYIELFAPVNGGAEISPRAIRGALTAAGITHGIQDRVIMELAMSKPYGKGEKLIAIGTAKEDGTAAFITELFPRALDLVPFNNGDGTVDFKKLNVVREIAVGTVIATMTPATAGTNGTNVKGEPVKALPGKPKSLMRGNNTVISENGQELTASVNGHLTFVSDRFNVESTFVVDGNVDNNTGNISFIGDMLIKGDVREGYEIRSTAGSIRVKGTVEGASLYAEKDIFMEGGFNGMKRGEVSSNTNIVSKFLQNCTVHAKENITTETIINSMVECDGDISVLKGKGTIVGGKVTALHSVEANIIGSDVNTPTNITVGLSPTVVAEKQKLERELKDVEDSKEALHKNLIYLERCAKMGPLSPKNLALVESCNKQKVLNLVRESKCTRRLAEVNTIIEEAASGSFVKSKVAYPSTKISIQSISFITKDVYNRSIFRKEDGEIKITNF